MGTINVDIRLYSQKISMKACGLFLMLSYFSDGGVKAQVSYSEIKKHTSTRGDSIATCFKELVSAGCLTKENEREQGRFTSPEYFLHPEGRTFKVHSSRIQFLALKNDFILDSGLALSSKGMLAYLSYLEKQEKGVNIRLLKSLLLESNDAIRTMLSDLSTHGYLNSTHERAASGRFQNIKFKF